MSVVRTEFVADEQVKSSIPTNVREAIRPVDSPVAAALTRMHRGHARTPFESKLIAELHGELFQRREDLRTSEQCELSYRRLRHLGRTLNLKTSELLGNLDQLLALQQWSGLVDGTVMTLLTIHFNLCVGSIVNHGAGRPELEPLLEELERLDTVGVFLATELAYGNNVQSLETEAVYDHERREFVLHTPNHFAQKFMPNTGAPGIPKLAVVMARLKVAGRDCGIYPFIVRIRTAAAMCEGVHVTSLGEKPDYPLDNAVTSFNRVRVPFGHWLSGGHSQIDDSGVFSSAIKNRRMRFMHSMERVQTGKLCLSAAAVGVASAGLKLALAYATQRKTFGPVGGEVPIFGYRSFQLTMFDAVAANYASAIFVQHAKAVCERTEPGDFERNQLLAMCKVFSSARALQILTTCRERVGAQGMFSANRIMSYLIQVNGTITAEGDNELLLIKVGRELLQQGNGDAEVPAGSAVLPLIESLDYLVSLVRHRERAAVANLRRSIATTAKQLSQSESWNLHLSEIIELASLHAVRLALECFNQALDTVIDPNARAIADRLARLFALSELTQLTTPLLLDGAIDAALVRRIGPERVRLAGELSADVTTIIESFDIPNSLLAAPIGEDYLTAYDFMSERPAPLESLVVPSNGRAE